MANFRWLCTLMITIAVINSIDTEQTNDNKLTFRAAVLDQITIRHPENVLHNLELNLKYYIEACKMANNDHVDLIVFPEEGLVSPIGNREQSLLHSEQIPQPNEQQSLCKDVKNLESTSATLVERLSCLALKSNMYLVANVLDKQPCHESDFDDPDRKCPKDGLFVFNTAVMFNRKGALIAKYHKMHPFGELVFNYPPKDQLIYVKTTDIGNVGLQICFDIIYEKPGHLMAEQSKVDTVITLMDWYDEAPHLSGTQYQMAWSYGNKVNLLVPGMHHPKVGTVGSGIYVPQYHDIFIANYWNETGITRLLIGDLPIKARSDETKNFKINGKMLNVVIPQVKSEAVSSTHLYIQMNPVNSTMVPLNVSNKLTKVTTSHNGVECHLEYEADFSKLSDEGAYYLMAANRTRPSPAYNWGEEFCLITYLSKNNIKVTFESNDIPIFKYAKLNGKFDSKTVIYPSAAGFHHTALEPLTYWKYDYATKTIQFGDQKSDKFEKLTTLSLYGRAYQRDPPYRQVPV